MKLSFSLIARFLKDYFITHYYPEKPVAPLLLAYFVTFRCNLHCAYCVREENLDVAGYPEVNTEQAIKILKLVRKGAPSIAFSGGEPLLRDDIVELLRIAKSAGFKPISLFTNALLLPQKEEVLKFIDFLQISLDTLDETKQDKIFGSNKNGSAKEIKTIIEFYAEQQIKKDFRINLNAVITPHTIDDIPPLYEYARDIGVRLTVCPQLKAGHPIPALIDNRKYRSLVNRMLTWKQNDPTLMDTVQFLNHIKTFEPFNCYPYLTPRIYPNGELIAPCPSIRKVRLNLLNFNSWDEAFQQAIKNEGTGFRCAASCFLPCYLETSTLLSNLPQTFREFTRLSLGNSNVRIKRHA